MWMASSRTSGSWNESQPSVAQPPSRAVMGSTRRLSAAMSSGRLLIRRHRSLLPAPQLARQLLPPFEAFLDVLLEPILSRLVPALASQCLRQVLLGDVSVVVGMRVLVPRPVSQLFHERRRGVADVQGHALRRVLGGRLRRAVVCGIHAIRFWRRRQVHRRLRQRELSLRAAEEVVGVFRGPRDREGARRASPSASRASSASASSSSASRKVPSPRSLSSSARRTSWLMCSGVSGSSTNTRHRDSSAPVSSKLGFSVVAPMRVTIPFSTHGRKASCCALLKRWISSQNRIVPRPSYLSRCSAALMISRTLATPSVTAENGSNWRSV